MTYLDIFKKEYKKINDVKNSLRKVTSRLLTDFTTGKFQESKRDELMDFGDWFIDEFDDPELMMELSQDGSVYFCLFVYFNLDEEALDELELSEYAEEELSMSGKYAGVKLTNKILEVVKDSEEVMITRLIAPDETGEYEEHVTAVTSVELKNEDFKDYLVNVLKIALVFDRSIIIIGAHKDNVTTFYGVNTMNEEYDMMPVEQLEAMIEFNEEGNDAIDKGQIIFKVME